MAGRGVRARSQMPHQNGPNSRGGDGSAHPRQNLRFFRRNGCRPELVVLAVGAAAAPEEAVAAAAAVEGVLRDVYDPVFRSVDILRFADAGTLAGRVRIRVFYHEC